MENPKPLNSKYLRKKLDISELHFKTTKDIKELNSFVGQERAAEALIFGIAIESHGYNLYAMGPSGIGKRSLVNNVLSKVATKRSAPSDWCYLHNFETPEKPIALELQSGKGIVLQSDMKQFVEELSVSIVTVFESNEYRVGMKKISSFYEEKRKKILKLNSNKKIDRTPLSYKKQHEKEKEFEEKSILNVIKPMIHKLKKKYKDYNVITQFLMGIQKDILFNVSDYVRKEEKTNLFTFLPENPSLTNYKINLLVDNSKIKHAPIVFEENPSYSTLVCRVEYTSHLGILSTNFTLIKSGSLHQANNGYLIIEARKLKKNQEAWEALKNALYFKQIKIKPFEHVVDSIKPVSLEPDPIPLNIKVILLGDRSTYYSLCQNDPDFIELFKVAIDFDEEIDRNKKNIQLYARLIGTIAKRIGLKPLSVSAVAEIIDHSSRLAEDVEKMSAHIREIEDIIVEAGYWSKIKNKKVIDKEDVLRAIEAQIYRMGRSRDLYYEDIHRKFIIINTKGKLVGEVNCLSVRKVGNFSYGHPSRVTARIRVGKGKVIDIQREIKLAGPLHSKASLIISNYLSSQFCEDQAFGLSASIAFEQIYCWTDGDSASVGELCAILSAISNIPIRQSLAVTGSIDQYGEVQAVGGVNEKIEGYFDVCKAKGLTGKEGVLIPYINVKNLMLREDIIKATKLKQFLIYPIKRIEEAVYLLTGVVAGEKNKEKKFPKDSVYYQIEKKLQKIRV